MGIYPIARLLIVIVIVTSELYAKMLRYCCHKNTICERYDGQNRILLLYLFHYKSKIIEFTHLLRLSITILFRLETVYMTLVAI